MASSIQPIRCLTRLLGAQGLPAAPYVGFNRNISTTNVLFAEPLRKKRRVDPAVLKARVEKKMSKLEREIDRLEKEPKQLIPILEYQLNNSDIRDLKARPSHTLEEVNLTESTIKGAKMLWNLYRIEQSRMEERSIRKVLKAQDRALQTLRDVDKSLYKRTVAMDEVTLLPYKSSHMRKETPPNPDYTPPDGYVKDISKKWIM